MYFFKPDAFEAKKLVIKWLYYCKYFYLKKVMKLICEFDLLSYRK